MHWMLSVFVMIKYEFVLQVFSYRTPASFAACSDIQVVGTNHVLAGRESEDFRQKVNQIHVTHTIYLCNRTMSRDASACRLTAFVMANQGTCYNTDMMFKHLAFHIRHLYRVTYLRNRLHGV